MTPEFWHQRWQRGEIGWHSDAINRHLKEYWPVLTVPPAARVLVPLCGKSLDMLWLAGRGHRVVGVELSPIAAAAFFEQQGLTPQVTDLAPAPFERYSVDELEVWVGDFFHLTPELLRGADGDGAAIDAVYDRAALIALPPDLRPAYARHLVMLLRTVGGKTVTPSSLLVTLEYEQSQMHGPPFAVGAGEVQTLFGNDFDIEPLATFDALAENPRFRERGLTRLTEHVYRLTLREPSGASGLA